MCVRYYWSEKKRSNGGHYDIVNTIKMCATWPLLYVSFHWYIIIILFSIIRYTCNWNEMNCLNILYVSWIIIILVNENYHSSRQHKILRCLWKTGKNLKHIRLRVFKSIQLGENVRVGPRNWRWFSRDDDWVIDGSHNSHSRIAW